MPPKKSRPNKLVLVVSAEEEWRTTGNRRFPRGRACMWLKLECGHYPVQRMVRLNRDKTVTPPKRVRCDECGPASSKA